MQVVSKNFKGVLERNNFACLFKRNKTKKIF